MKIFIAIITLILIVSCRTEVLENKTPNIKVSLNASNEQQTVSSELCLNFEIQGEKVPQLYLTNAIGSTIITGTRKNSHIRYCFPKSYTRHAGLLKWKMVSNGEIIENGEVNMRPDSTFVFMESYFGPRQITAGDIDFSMLTNIPTDQFDNLLPDGTTVTIKRQFENQMDEYAIETSGGIAWKNIGATKKAGRMLVSSACLGTYSKQLTTMVYSAIPADFTIHYERDHSFADGNQILTLKTSKIVDDYNNIVSDGTYVNFIVEDASGTLLRTSGNTQNGMAIAKILHPERPTKWNIKAYVTGAATSNRLAVSFDQSVKDFEVSFDENEREVVIGPLYGFINQKVPDGISITIELKSEEHLILEKTKLFTKNGMTSLKLPAEFYPPGTYAITINSMGIKKELTIKLYGDKK
ncbi:hypothetical protein [uncultured Kriegella sp.]|uniref:hypothetical protein n=1 Tax=uncultured Kriegella sp. TaxID=1798910 RepID=UPI0030DB4F9D|tara:strand:- start:96845 stop:98074 length:1230 start_codon:yes stop_codon:yes gene_type:complete